MGRTEARPQSISPRALAIVGWSAFAIAGLTFLALAWNVAAHAPLLGIDAGVTEWLQARRTAPLSALMLAVTHANSVAAIGLWSLGFGAILWRLRERYWLLTLAVCVVGGMVVNGILKLAYERARPAAEGAMVTLSTFSFPSGHTAAAVTFYGVVAAFLVSRSSDPARRAASVFAAAAIVAIVAFSRVYLGAHYLSDVIAAACSATAWLALCLSVGRALVHRREAARNPGL